MRNENCCSLRSLRVAIRAVIMTLAILLAVLFSAQAAETANGGTPSSAATGTSDTAAGATPANWQYRKRCNATTQRRRTRKCRVGDTVFP
jgi:hypothetical protein